MGEEKRSAARHAVRFHLVYDDGSSYNAGTVRDVSETGLFLETAMPLSVGTVVTLTPLDREGHTTFEVRAEVMRVVPYEPDNTDGDAFAAGMGVHFRDLDIADRERVVGMIKELESSTQSSIDPFLGVRVPGTARDSANEE